MGCHDQGSNFNHFIYSEGAWWCAWGLDLKYTAPTRELIEDYVGAEFAKKLDFSLDTGKSEWTAVPKEAL